MHTKRRVSDVVYKRGKRVRTTKCTEDRVDLGKSGGYCRMCCRQQKKGIPVAQEKRIATLRGWGVLGAKSPYVENAGTLAKTSTRSRCSQFM